MVVAGASPGLLIGGGGNVLTECFRRFHLEDGRVMNEPVDTADGHGLVGEESDPAAEGYCVGCDDDAAYS